MIYNPLYPFNAIKSNFFYNIQSSNAMKALQREKSMMSHKSKIV